MTSHMLNVYGMRSEREMYDTYRDFCRDEGAPGIFHRDNAKAEKSQRVTEWNREHQIKESFTEPYHPQQNPAEARAVKFIKQHTQILMDRTGAPPDTWFFASQYVASVHNHTADPTLNWNTPYSRRHGITPDISKFLQFTFNEKVYYLDPGAKYPETKERTGTGMGPVDNVGDALTWIIRDDETNEILHHSVVRPYNDPKRRNARLHFDPDTDPERLQQLHTPADEPSLPALMTGETVPTTPNPRFSERRLKIDADKSLLCKKKQLRRQKR